MRFVLVNILTVIALTLLVIGWCVMSQCFHKRDAKSKTQYVALALIICGLVVDVISVIIKYTL